MTQVEKRKSSPTKKYAFKFKKTNDSVQNETNLSFSTKHLNNSSTFL